MNIRNFYLFGMIFILLLLGACGTKSSTNDAATNNSADEEVLENVNKEGMPIVNEKISLDFFVGQSPASAEDWNDVMIFNEYEDMTNIDINWEMIPNEGLAEKRNLVLSGGDGSLPDAFHNAIIPVKDIYKYGEQELFIPLNDLIDEYAPNINKIFEEHPDIKKALTYPDGNIYSFPTLDDPEFLSMRAGATPWFRGDWLDELGLDIPQTTEQFYEFLKAVKEDLDVEGKVIPYGSTSIDSLVTYLNGAYGIGNKGITSGYLDEDPENTGKVRFFPATDEYKEVLQFVNKLYEEELIDQNIFSTSHEEFYANGAEGVYGSFVGLTPFALFTGEASNSYTGGYALEGPYGDKSFNGLRFPVVVPGSFVITSVNEHPEATVRWVDHFYGDEGVKLYLMGIEGKTFEVTEDGEYEFVDDIKDNPNGLNLDQGAAQYLTWPGGAYPSITKEEYFKGAEGTPSAKEAAEKLEPDTIEETWPNFLYTKEENDQLSGFGEDIQKYVGEMRDKFASGQIDFDEWDNYIDTLYDMNLEKYLEIQQNAYERFQDN